MQLMGEKCIFLHRFEYVAVGLLWMECDVNGSIDAFNEYIFDKLDDDGFGDVFRYHLRHIVNVRNLEGFVVTEKGLKRNNGLSDMEKIGIILFLFCGVICIGIVLYYCGGGKEREKLLQQQERKYDEIIMFGTNNFDGNVSK